VAFRFRYEGLLSYRGHMKEMAEIELAASQEALEGAEGTLHRLLESFDDTNASMRLQLSSAMPAQIMKAYADYLADLSRRITRQRKTVSEREKAVGEKRADLLEKAKERKIIEKLKERDYSKWQDQQNRQEQKRLAEVAILRHGRAYP
jgi:flagellar FliJ protein